MTQRRTAQQASQPGPKQAAQESATAALQPQLQDQIGRQLRALYDDILSQPVPERFRELMERLDGIPTGTAETET